MAMDSSSIYEKNVSEESGWTAYLEDFSGNSDDVSSSLVSDAAWNGSDTIRRLGLKKLKKKSGINQTKLYDDDLEDTASSPVNSPKISTMTKQMEVNHTRMDDVISCDFLGQQSSSNNFLKHHKEEKNTKNEIDGKIIDDEYMELRKRGLCLVPMSTFINYINST